MKSNIEEKVNSVYDFIISFSELNGYPPSVRDICSSLSIKSTATAYLYLEKLIDKGLLNKSPLKKRSISITQKNCYKSVPLIGTITAGVPIFAVENLDGYIPLPQEFDNNSDEFALRVKGNSMINADIHENDIIIVAKQDTADNGDIVVALIDDSATVKRFFKKDNHVVLHPENDQMQDMIFENVSILGIVKGLIRKF